MDDADMQEIARSLLNCREAFYERGGFETMMLYLNRLYQVIVRLVNETFATQVQGLKPPLAMMEKKARALKQQIEERLAVRD